MNRIAEKEHPNLLKQPIISDRRDGVDELQHHLQERNTKTKQKRKRSIIRITNILCRRTDQIIWKYRLVYAKIGKQRSDNKKKTMNKSIKSSEWYVDKSVLNWLTLQEKEDKEKRKTKDGKLCDMTLIFISKIHLYVHNTYIDIVLDYHRSIVDYMYFPTEPYPSLYFHLFFTLSI